MPRSKLNPRVFWGASAVIAAMLLSTLAAPGASAAQNWAIGTFGWLYVASVAAFLVLVLALGFGPAGKLRLGPDDAEPDFPYVSWLAMLFAAGMGIARR